MNCMFMLYNSFSYISIIKDRLKVHSLWNQFTYRKELQSNVLLIYTTDIDVFNDHPASMH